MTDTITMAELRQTELYQNVRRLILKENMKEHNDYKNKLVEEASYTYPVINNGGNLEELNTKVQDASTSLESTPPINAEPVGRYYWESVVDGHFMAVPSEGTIHYEIDDFPLYLHPVKEQELLDEIAQLKHINRNWQISENILLLELEKLQMRELTDEEIMELQAEYGIDSDLTCHSVKDFVSAILRKANEK